MTAIAERPGPERRSSPYLEGVFAPIDDRDRRRVRGDRRAARRISPACSCATGRTRCSRRRVGTTGSTATACCTRCTSRTARATYRNRCVRTEALAAESRRRARRCGPASTSAPTSRNPAVRSRTPRTPTSCSTPVGCSRSGGSAVPATRSRCRRSRPSVEYDFGGTLTTGLTAHPKLDPETGELMVFDYNVAAAVPDLQRHVGATGGWCTTPTIDLPGPAPAARPRDHRAAHDLPRLPADVGPGAAGAGEDEGDVPHATCRPASASSAGTRDGDAIRWFEAESCYMYHTINAWESGDEIVLVGCRIENPLAGVDDDERRAAHRRAAARAVPARVAVQPRHRRGARARARRRDDRVPAHEQRAARSADALLVQPAHRGAADAALRRVREVRHRHRRRAPRTRTATAASAARPCSRRGSARPARGRRLRAHVRHRGGHRRRRRSIVSTRSGSRTARSPASRSRNGCRSDTTRGGSARPTSTHQQLHAVSAGTPVFVLGGAQTDFSPQLEPRRATTSRR